MTTLEPKRKRSLREVIAFSLLIESELFERTVPAYPQQRDITSPAEKRLFVPRQYSTAQRVSSVCGVKRGKRTDAPGNDSSNGPIPVRDGGFCCYTLESQCASPAKPLGVPPALAFRL